MAYHVDVEKSPVAANSIVDGGRGVTAGWNVVERYRGETFGIEVEILRARGGDVGWRRHLRHGSELLRGEAPRYMRHDVIRGREARRAIRAVRPNQSQRPVECL